MSMFAVLFCANAFAASLKMPRLDCDLAWKYSSHSVSLKTVEIPLPSGPIQVGGIDVERKAVLVPDDVLQRQAIAMKQLCVAVNVVRVDPILWRSAYEQYIRLLSSAVCSTYQMTSCPQLKKADTGGLDWGQETSAPRANRPRLAAGRSPTIAVGSGLHMGGRYVNTTFNLAKVDPSCDFDCSFAVTSRDSVDRPIPIPGGEARLAVIEPLSHGVELQFLSGVALVQGLMSSTGRGDVVEAYGEILNISRSSVRPSGFGEFRLTVSGERNAVRPYGGVGLKGSVLPGFQRDFDPGQVGGYPEGTPVTLHLPPGALNVAVSPEILLGPSAAMGLEFELNPALVLLVDVPAVLLVDPATGTTGFQSGAVILIGFRPR